VEKLYLELKRTCNIQLVWKSYTWNCKEHVIYSLCGKVIPGTCKEHVIYSLCGKVIPGTVKNM
jgi:hypothetical protein